MTSLASNSLQDWLIAIAAIASWMLLFHLGRQLVLTRLRRIAQASPTVIDDFVVDVLEATRFLLAAAIGLYLATTLLALPTRLETGLHRAVVGLMVLQAGLWAERALRFWLQHQFASGEHDDPSHAGSRAMTRTLLTFMGRVVVWVVVTLMILDNLGMNITALVASMGIGGVAVALAVQNILGDLFASLSITIDKPFVIGDFIIVGDCMGTVEHVGLKTTRLRSLSGEQLIFANNDLLRSRIRNYKRMQERRATFTLGITYDTPVALVEQVPSFIQQAIESAKLVRFDRAHFKAFGASSLDFEAVYYLLDPDFNLYMDAQQAINLHLLRRFQAEGIDFAFPTQTVYLAHGAHSPAPASSLQTA